MSNTRLVAIPCTISRGVVSDERAFEISTYPGGVHSGVAPVYYFWNEAGNPLTPDEPNGDQELSGKIAARFLERQASNTLVAIPDGSVIPVDSKLIAKRPTEVVINVPI